MSVFDLEMKIVVKENAFCFLCSKAALNTGKQVLAWFDLDSCPAFILISFSFCFFPHTMSRFRLCVNKHCIPGPELQSSM